MQQTPKQQSYLLRLWPVSVDGQVIWRAYLMPVPDGKGQGFADLKQLFAYLESLTAQELPPNPKTV